MNLSTPDVVAIVSVLLAVSGMVFALKRQENVLADQDNTDWRQKFYNIEQANRYLLETLRAYEKKCGDEQGRMQAEINLLRETIEQMSIEAKSSNERRMELATEIDALRKVINAK